MTSHAEPLIRALVVARWQAVGSPVVPVTWNERGQPYITVRDVAAFLSHHCPACAPHVVTAVEWIGERGRA